MSSLELQVSMLRDEMAGVYKTQSTNAQRLVAMNETLREKEEFARIEAENSRMLKDDIINLRQKVDHHNELIQEKDRTAQVNLLLMIDLFSPLFSNRFYMTKSVLFNLSLVRLKKGTRS